MIMLPSEEPAETREVELPDLFKASPTRIYAALKAIIEPITGYPLEHVNVLADFAGGKNFRHCDMFVNELGHVVKPPLPRNEEATAIYRRNALMHQGYTDPEELPWIAGPAVLFEHTVWH
ncbi:hypothetical protein ACC806_34660 [Rhizobium ruizarguesonis]